MDDAVRKTPAPPAGLELTGPLTLGPSVAAGPGLFQSYFIGGFECSTHRRRDGRRLDLIGDTRHDVLAASDYRQLAEHGIRAARDGVRWHLIEAKLGRHDWSSALPALRAARLTGTQVAWDLCHYGWPDGLDVFSAAFVKHFARFAGAFAKLHLEETGCSPTVCPVNEISFFSWAGGEVGLINPCLTGRRSGIELKRQLVRAAVAGTRAVLEAAPGARILAIDPIINVVPRSGQDPAKAAERNEGQFEAWDMLAGLRAPELGGGPAMIDVIGVNYYWNNQWLHGGERQPVLPSDPGHRPLRDLLAEIYARYRRPIFMAETSIEGEQRAPWLRYIGEEVRAAIRVGVPVEGICLYPVLSHRGWDNDRYCPNGLFELHPSDGRRPVHASLAAELREQQRMFRGMAV